MAEPAARLEAADLVEGLYLGHALAALRTHGLTERLRTPAHPAELAADCRVDRHVLVGMLHYLAARTTLVSATSPGRFVLSDGYDAQAAFLIDLYGRAFAPLAASIGTLLRRPGEGPRLVDRGAQSDAFTDDEGTGALTDLLGKLAFTSMLDLGCGTGSVLRSLASRDLGFSGIGIDANPAMCRAGRRLGREAGLGRRVRLVVGDARFPARVVEPRARRGIEALLARDFVNELCRDDGRRAIAWLRRLRRVFPGRALVVADYYGRLGTPGEPTADRHVLLHDFVQLLSGQGIPPSDADGWERLYAAAGCRLAAVIEDSRSPRFVHVVKLEPAHERSPPPLAGTPSERSQ